MDDEDMTVEEFDLRMEQGEEVQIFYPRSQYHKVRRWHVHFGIPASDEPQLLPEGRRVLREALIREELKEFLDALEEGDLEHAAKELGDLAWVVNGAAVEMGLDLDLIVSAIYKSNMTKLGNDGEPILRWDGKILKGPNYIEADLSHIL